MGAKWHFEKQQPGQGAYNPLTQEFFDQGDEWKPGLSLVRESIQNSIDAKVDPPVSVNIHVSADDALSAEQAQYWFGTLWPHLRDKECQVRGIRDKPTAGGFIVIEDYGTCGLRGDVQRWQSLRQGEADDYFSFFWAEGLSGKTSGAGSWGAGKSVFNRCSGINTFLAASVRSDTRDAVVIGKSVLRCHYVGATPYQAVGRFGVRESDEGIILPGTDDALIKRFASDFRVLRFSGSERQPGLSVVIPYRGKDVTPDAILSTVVEEYFQPILAGRLVVAVSGDGWKRRRVLLDADTIKQEAESGNRGLKGVVALAEWALVDGSNCLTRIEPQRGDSAPNWDSMPLNADAEKLKDLSERYERGDMLALRIPLTVRKKDERPRQSYFDVFLQKDLDGEGYKPVFVRDGIVIPNVRERSTRGHELLALIMIEDEPLTLMLRAAEPPAHDQWISTTQNFKGLYDFGQQTINFVKGAPKQLADLFSGARTERDDFALADLFPEPDDDGRPRPEDRPKKRKKGIAPELPPLPPPRPKSFRIQEIDGGFRVVRENASVTSPPNRLVVRVAYDTSRGNPLSKYHPADFVLEKLDRVASGGDIAECEENRLVFEPTNDDFVLQVTGFDTNRDLHVKVRTEALTSAEEDDE